MFALVHQAELSCSSGRSADHSASPHQLTAQMRNLYVSDWQI